MRIALTPLLEYEHTGAAPVAEHEGVTAFV